MGNLPAAALRILAGLDSSEPFNADRLFRLLYLADWKSTLELQRTVTGITWTAAGPSDLVGDVPDRDAEFVSALQQISGELDNDAVLRLVKSLTDPTSELAEQDAQMVDFVIAQAGPKSWRELNKLVFSTRPLVAGPHDQPLDLERSAAEHKATKRYRPRLEHA